MRTRGGYQMSSCEVLMKKGGELSDAFAVRCGESAAVAKAAGVTTCGTAIEGGRGAAGEASGCRTVVSPLVPIDPSCEQQGIAAWIVVTGAVMQQATAHAGRTPAASTTTARRAVIDARNREVLVGFC
jgi:hypothetical protein